MEKTRDGTLGESVYLRMRQDIVFGVLAPGLSLKLDLLRERYGASVTTLRETLNRLAADGFAQPRGQKGFMVTPISRGDLEEIAELRILVEGYALGQSIENGDLGWEAAATAAHYRLHALEVRMIAGEELVRRDWKDADWQFHHALLKGCGSRNLLDLHGTIFDKYLRYQMIALTFRGAEAAKEHDDLLEAAIGRDVTRARALLDVHIRKGVEASIAGNPDW